MKRRFRLVKIVALLVAAVVATVAVVLVVSFSGMLPISDGQRLPGVEVVKDGFVSAFIVDVGEAQVALVDAGNDGQAAPILRALGRRNLGADAVKAILLPHGDRDHTSGVRAFPGAEVMALAPDVALAEGRAARGIFRWFGQPRPSGITIARTLHEGETVTVGEVAFRVFAVPGHTAGSAAYLARSVLFMGDSAEATKDGKLAPGRRLFTDDPAQNRASLRRLDGELRGTPGEVKAIACAHSGVLEKGLAPLTEVSARRD